MKKTKNKKTNEEKLILISEKKAQITNLFFNTVIAIIFSYLLTTSLVNAKILMEEVKLWFAIWLIIPLFIAISVFEVFKLHTILLFSQNIKK